MTLDIESKRRLGDLDRAAFLEKVIDDARNPNYHLYIPLHVVIGRKPVLHALDTC